MYFPEIVRLISFPIFAYLLGSIPWGVILTRKFTSIDILQNGSKNIGAANVKRVAGLKLALLTLAGDFLKGALPVFLALVTTDQGDFRWEMYVSLVAFCAFSGHLYPVFLKCRSGGKGVATAAGCFLVLCPIACCAAFLVYITVVWLFKRASLGSLVSSAVLPVAVWLATRSSVLTCFAVLTTAMIYCRHKDNIRRLLSGTEPVIWGGKDR